MVIDEMNDYYKEQQEHRDMLLDIQAVLATKSGKNFIKYLFVNFEVGELPVIGLTNEFLLDRLGFLRAGNSIFKIVAEASPEIAGQILGQIEKVKNEQNAYAQARFKN